MAQQLTADGVPAIVAPEAEIALQILALNTEKAHNRSDELVTGAGLFRRFAAS